MRWLLCVLVLMVTACSADVGAPAPVVSSAYLPCESAATCGLSDECAAYGRARSVCSPLCERNEDCPAAPSGAVQVFALCRREPGAPRACYLACIRGSVCPAPLRCIDQGPTVAGICG